ncbi:peptidoglycan recognition protein family protein [Enterococcus asini]|uniref:peptidoglycan recognition protein family protein n=1 Tax=Enterococcus asini TaxID=57732 RepID=UPI00266BF69A|nr:N-acetylmuramoyl-L-alanine amidase [Enterococcus asini]
MSFIKHEYIGINKYSRPGIKNNGIKGLIMHYTANNGGTARNHKSYFNNLSGNYASAQLFVDDMEALCIIPLDEVAYHANDIQKYVNGQPYYPLRGIIGNANYSTIGLEMCLDANGNITEATFQNSVKAAKELIKMYPQITADRIWRHYDVTGKNCPAPWVAKPSELDRFKKAVFSQSSTPVTPETPKQKKKAGNVMLLFQEKGKVYLLVGNKYTYVEGPKHLDAIKLAMDKAGYDTWVHTNATQIKYFKKIAELVK